MKGFFVPSEFLWGKRISEDVIDKKTGEVLLNCNEQITPEIADKITDLKIDSFKILHTNELDMSKMNISCDFGKNTTS